MAKLKAPFALDRSLNTTEQTSRNIADVLAEELSAIITALGGLNFINYEVVEELPTTEISTTTIYLVPSDDPQSGNTYDEYINLNGTVSGWEKIGSTAIDLSGYYTSAETDALLDEKVDKDSFDEQTATDEFSTINGGLLSSLKVALSPNQDLHGYPEPWVGGAGKNKLELNIDTIKALNTAGTWNGNNYTLYGVTYSVITDNGGNITEVNANSNGAATANCSLYLKSLPQLTDNTDYVMNGCPSGGSDSTYRLGYSNMVNHAYSDTGSGVAIRKFDETTYPNARVAIAIFSGYTANNLKFYPMIRLATESDPTFEPYSNICPISGHTQVVVGDDGKNRLSFSFTTRTVNGITFNAYSDGTVMVEEGGTATANADCILGTYDNGGVETILNGCPSGGSSSTYMLNATGGYSDTGNGVNLPASYNNQVYIRIRSGYTIPSGGLLFKPMIRLASDTDPTFVPYNGYQVTVNLGGTYYSGTLDVVSGIFIPDTAKQTYPWGTYTRTDDLGNTRRRILATLSDALGTVSSDIGANISDSVEEQTGWTTDSPHFYIDSSNKTLVVFLPISTSDSTNIEVCYKLATPTPIQLSPTMVKALVGENHLSAPLEGQEITESKYKKMFTFDDVIAYIQSL